VTLTKTNHYIAENSRLKRTIESALKAAQMEYGGTVRVRHLLEIVVNEVGEQKVKANIKRKLTGLKVAPYYGCQLTRPFGTIDDEEFPTLLDRLVVWLGAQPVNYPVKAKCCGGMLVMTDEKVGLGLTRGLLDCAVQNGADCIATICPLCHMNLETYQGSVNKLFRTNFHVPTIYFTQLLGLALGFSRKSLGMYDDVLPSDTFLRGIWRGTSDE
jgi:heterodisulfide reductase subunit B